MSKPYMRCYIITTYLACISVLKKMTHSFASMSHCDLYLSTLVLVYMIPFSVKYLSASNAAIQPVPAAVTACLYTLSAASPEANTPSILV